MASIPNSSQGYIRILLTESLCTDAHHPVILSKVELDRNLRANLLQNVLNRIFGLKGPFEQNVEGILAWVFPLTDVSKIAFPCLVFLAFKSELRRDHIID